MMFKFSKSRSNSWVFSSILLTGVVGLSVACQQAAPPRPEATSLLGQPLVSPDLPPDIRTRLEENLARAKAELDRNPDDPEAIIWVGRRTAYLGRYREAIAIYSDGIEKHPGNAKLYRHRGHRYLTVREIEKAITDFEKAADLMTDMPDEIEPDGMPNEKGIPRSTTQSNIWYHLGLAYYLEGRFADARQAFSTCTEFSKNDDMVVATAYWLYLTLRQLGLNAEAETLLDGIHGEMDVIENFSYYELLLLYKGEKSGERSPKSLLATTEADAVTSATLLYGLARWHSMMGASEKTNEVLTEILEGEQWAAFGYLAAEAELARSTNH